MKLIEDWKQAHKKFSVIISSAGALLMSVFTLWPDSILTLWSVMPVEVRALIPEQLATGIAAFIFIMTAISRVIKQGGENGKG